MCICRPIVRLGCHIFVLRVNLPGLTDPNLAGLGVSELVICLIRGKSAI